MLLHFAYLVPTSVVHMFCLLVFLEEENCKIQTCCGFRWDDVRGRFREDSLNSRVRKQQFLHAFCRIII